MHDRQPDPTLDKEENTVRGLLRVNMDAAVERLREDADKFPDFNQMAKVPEKPTATHSGTVAL